jgi:hypothetical protein
MAKDRRSMNARRERWLSVSGLVGASLRGKHGFDSHVLTIYGFKPREWVKKDYADLALELEREEREAGGEETPEVSEE